MRIHDDQLLDLEVGATFVRVRRGDSAATKLLLLETLIGETTPVGDSLWAAADTAGLRQVVEVTHDGFPLYAPNRLLPEKAAAAIQILSEVTYKPGAPDPKQHPLGIAAEAQRLGIWALSEERTPIERKQSVAALEGVFQRFFIPAKHALAAGAAAWAYPFDFTMPWGTVLKSPWYSGYANSVVASAAACLARLTGNAVYRELALEAIGFLRLPTEQGGALYEIDGNIFVAEYVYRSPPIPNYRVLDGELMSLVFLHAAVQLLQDLNTLHFFIRLGNSLRSALPLFASSNGQPVFGMDGQPMNPGYMWQLWVALQVLANVFKDRGLTELAHKWREGVPEQFIRDGFPV